MSTPFRELLPVTDEIVSAWLSFANYFKISQGLTPDETDIYECAIGVLSAHKQTKDELDIPAILEKAHALSARPLSEFDASFPILKNVCAPLPSTSSTPYISEELMEFYTTLQRAKYAVIVANQKIIPSLNTLCVASEGYCSQQHQRAVSEYFKSRKTFDALLYATSKKVADNLQITLQNAADNLLAAIKQLTLLEVPLVSLETQIERLCFFLINNANMLFRNLYDFPLKSLSGNSLFCVMSHYKKHWTLPSSRGISI